MWSVRQPRKGILRLLSTLGLARPGMGPAAAPVGSADIDEEWGDRLNNGAARPFLHGLSERSKRTRTPWKPWM